MKTTENNNTLLNEGSLEFEQMVQKLKNKYGNIYQIEIADQRVIYKPLTRKEYKEVVAIKNEDSEELGFEREYAVAKFAIIYPQGKDLNNLLDNYAGVAEVITDECMKISGFLSINERTPIKL